ncbi:ATP synthase subunit O, mitochondrial [Armadillidium nasatum]|uniref:Oligomycin sensitivity conferral protein n=1 Tax=Armadillidium nasatum TaxID=96803 RepID=A0A5N5T3J4_9CRUS|nr:ATP synthase subunit O, mitochondrial [Armadillidium nasatum]
MATVKSGVNIMRMFSTSTSASQLVKPKVQVFGTEGRYAMALYSAASKKKALNDVERDLNTLSGLLKTDSILREFLFNPLLSKDLKKSALDSVLKKKQASPLTANLLNTMTDNGRIQSIESVASSFSVIMAAERGEIICEVTTAKELDAPTKKELETVLKSFVKKGENIQLTLKVDPSLIGGMVVAIGDKYVDMSISSKINKYTELIQAAV